MLGWGFPSNLRTHVDLESMTFLPNLQHIGDNFKFFLNQFIKKTPDLKDLSSHSLWKHNMVS